MGTCTVCLSPRCSQFWASATWHNRLDRCLAGAHEAGHFVAARQQGVKLLPPFLIPAGLGIIGSFGAITPVRDTLKQRLQLLRIAEAGPAAGTVVSAALVLGGLALSVAKAGPLVQVRLVG